LATRGISGKIDDNEMWQHGVTPNSRGLSRKHLLQAVEASLRRLQTDYIDIYVVHFWDPFTPVEETLETMRDLVLEGKVRYIGCSQTLAWQLYRGLWVSELKTLPRYQSVQVRFNLLERDPAKELLPAAEAAGVSVLAFQSLAGNVLRGEFAYGSERPSGLGYRKVYTDMYWTESNFAFVEKLREIARDSGRSPGELAQAWVLAQESVAALQIGPNEPEEFDSQVRAVDFPLSDDERDAIDSLLQSEGV
jgi:aryl-alcohol dehydrogenase-like predicted oxidoreductase